MEPGEHFHLKYVPANNIRTRQSGINLNKQNNISLGKTKLIWEINEISELLNFFSDIQADNMSEKKSHEDEMISDFLKISSWTEK